MNLKVLVPDDVIVAMRLARTLAILSGVHDRSERRQRAAVVRKLIAQAAMPSNGKRVLFFSFRGWYPHVAWEAILAHSLRIRGATVHMFNCGGQLPICEVNFRHANPGLACRECAAYPEALIAALGISRSWLHEYLSPHEQSEITATVKRLDPAEYTGWMFEGIPVGQLVADSARWFLRKSKLDMEGRDGRVYRDFLISGAQVACIAPRLLSRMRPAVVVELNGRFFAERILNHCAGETTRVVTYEAGWRKNTLGFDRLSELSPVDLGSVWTTYQNKPLLPHEERELDEWIQTRAGGDMQRDFYIHFQEQESGDPLRRLGLNRALPTAVLFTNLVWDTAVLNRDQAFPSILDWVKTTIRLFRDWPGRQLIIRVHPAEDLRPSMESSEKVGSFIGGLGPLPRNVRVVPARHELSSYALMGCCQAGLVYTSTAGLEMALRGKPVVVSARVYYRGCGFTYDVERATDYGAVIAQAFDAPRLDSKTINLARRFAYLLLFRYLHKLPVVNQRAGRLPILEPSETELLLPGALPEFDHLLAAIQTGGELVPPCPSSYATNDSVENRGVHETVPGNTGVLEPEERR
jgi:hypothetical protein